jgi:hypothetical protein
MVRNKIFDTMTLKNGEIIHEKCYEGEYGNE